MIRFTASVIRLVLVVAAVAFLTAHVAHGASSTTPPRHATLAIGLTKDSPRPVVCSQAVDALDALAGAPGRDTAKVRQAVYRLAVRACIG